MKHLVDTLRQNRTLSAAEFAALLRGQDEAFDYLLEQSAEVTKQSFGDGVYLRGLIELTNYCKNDCYYCGIRRSNKKAVRYRLTKEEVLACCEIGYPLGFRTFVMQGGEDPFFTDDVLADIVAAIRARYPDCAITLSAGERSYDSYKRLFEAGANRYLLRHETANADHYSTLHPPSLTLEKRKECLSWLKEIGFQVGTGFMVGSPGQTLDHLVEDLQLIEQLQPHMVGIGPFIPHCDTPFADHPHGRMEQVLFLIGILRLMLPNALIPSTTALGSIAKDGRERGLLAGANVIMPNLSPVDVREKYMLYNNKLSTGAEAAEMLELLKQRLERIGRHVVVSRGDYHA